MYKRQGDQRARNYVKFNSACNIRGLAIVGNSFFWSQDNEIVVNDAGNNRRNTVIVGNTFTKCGGAYPDSKVNVGVNVIA